MKTTTNSHKYEPTLARDASHPILAATLRGCCATCCSAVAMAAKVAGSVRMNHDHRISAWSRRGHAKPEVDLRTLAGGIPQFFVQTVYTGRSSPQISGLLALPAIFRSEERRVGKECVSTCRSRWSPYH